MSGSFPMLTVPPNPPSPCSGQRKPEHRRAESRESEADRGEDAAVEELAPADADLFLVDGLVLDDLAAAPPDETTERRAGLVGAGASGRFEIG